MKDELRKFIYDVQEALLLQHIETRENNFLKTPLPDFFFSNRPTTTESSGIDVSSAEQNSSSDEDSKTSSPSFSSSPIDIDCRQEEPSLNELNETVSRIMSVNTIDIKHEGDDEKEYVSQEIDRLLYRPKTLLVFCDASYDDRSKQFSGAAAVYLSNKNKNSEYVKIIAEVIIRGEADNNNHAEVLTANKASQIADIEIRKWFKNGDENSIQSHEKPDKIVVYCDNMIPVNIFRWCKHNNNYTSRQKKLFWKTGF